MQIKCRKSILSFVFCMVFAMSVAVYTAGCGSRTESEEPDTGSAAESTLQEDKTLGEGEKAFWLTVVDKDGGETRFEIHTDQETVGEALSELGVIEGEESEYGLYVKTVNGITADFEQDGVYWAFYINDEYAQTGVDATVITEGESYSFKVE